MLSKVVLYSHHPDGHADHVRPKIWSNTTRAHLAQNQFKMKWLAIKAAQRDRRVGSDLLRPLAVARAALKSNKRTGLLSAFVGAFERAAAS